ncbi:GntR family transcriptional regulator [Phytohabitans sp. ZYX-F-186]|uniref:GntR family transcriptional regulator n=1 Tax=Phytohabitans maris TaxID=3071409 RepID=A0ABU0ZE75_9ACTN|nr:GntR family transcriptional regulator [Phytohabitans sp. ZYX-F-186]MDQ7904652.1 GntR family transcriptional regulator [Phytohabitans sp. ZYX-F-186]
MANARQTSTSGTTSAPDARQQSFYQFLKGEILAGAYAPGQSLVEGNLVELYGISRTPVREALQRLEQDGIVERGFRSAYQIKARSDQELLDLYDVWVALEELAGHTAASAASRINIAQLKGIHAAMEQCDRSDTESLEALDFSFHIAFAEATHNDALIEALDRIYNQIRATGDERGATTTPQRWADILTEHGELLTAIEAGDPEASARISREHMDRARSLRIALSSRGRPEVRGPRRLAAQRPR